MLTTDYKRVSWRVWGGEVRFRCVGQRGRIVLSGEEIGTGLFAGAEQLPGAGWHIELVCPEDVAQRLYEWAQSVEAGITRCDFVFYPDGKRAKVRDRIRVRTTRARLQPFPA